MKKRLLLIAVAAAMAVLFSSCVTINTRVNPQTQQTQAAEITALPETPTPVATTPPSSEPSDTALPSPSLTPDTSSPSPSLTPATTEQPADAGSYAYITDMFMRMDGQTDIVLDFADWLTGDEAKEKYLEDFPGATEEEMENAGIYEMGYIRNANDMERMFSTTPDTKYFLPDTEYNVIEVSYDEFRNRMFSALYEEIGSDLLFVEVKSTGKEITSIAWRYRAVI